MEQTCLSSTSHRCTIGSRSRKFGDQVKISNLMFCSLKVFLTLNGKSHYPADPVPLHNDLLICPISLCSASSVYLIYTNLCTCPLPVLSNYVSPSAPILLNWPSAGGSLYEPYKLEIELNSIQFNVATGSIISIERGTWLVTMPQVGGMWQAITNIKISGFPGEHCLDTGCMKPVQLTSSGERSVVAWFPGVSHLGDWSHT